MINNSTEIKKVKHEPEALLAKQNTCNNASLEIKEEQLDISKQWMQTGNVNVYRETFIVKKTFIVDVEREELVIENKVNNEQATNHGKLNTAIIRIPLSEQNVKFTKHRVALEDVSIYRKEIADIKSIEATLKKENLKIKISGDLKIRD